MSKIVGLTVLTLLTLSACQKTPEVTKASVDDLDTRIRALEQGQEAIVAEMRQNEQNAREREAKHVPSPPAPAPMTYELTGAGATRRTYPSAERCEAAREAMQEARNRANEGSGQYPRVIYAQELSCIPM